MDFNVSSDIWDRIQLPEHMWLLISEMFWFILLNFQLVRNSTGVQHPVGSQMSIDIMLEVN